MLMLLFLILGLSVPQIADSQVTCSRYASSTVCTGNGRSTTQTELSDGMGIIRNDRGDVTPYTFLNQREERRSPASAIQPLRELDRLPSLRDEEPMRFNREERDGERTFMFLDR